MNYRSAEKSPPEPAGPDDMGINVPVRLTKEELKDLSAINPTLACLHVAAEWGLIAVTIWLCQRFFNPMLYVFAVALIGSRQHALLVLMHDGTHYRLLGNRRLNDWLAEVILAWPHLISVRQYRKNHFAHHRHLNTAQDTDLQRRLGDPEWEFPLKAASLAKILVRDVTGLNARSMLRLVFSVASADAVPAWFLLTRYGFYAAALGTIACAGALKGFALYWIVPLFTWLALVMRVRGIAEHRAIKGPERGYPLTRTTDASLLERIFVAPKNVNYHIEHHFFPSVPFYRLPELHALLLTKPGFRQRAHLTRSYWRVLEEAAGRRPKSRMTSRGRVGGAAEASG